MNGTSRRSRTTSSKPLVHSSRSGASTAPTVARSISPIGRTTTRSRSGSTRQRSPRGVRSFTAVLPPWVASGVPGGVAPSRWRGAPAAGAAPFRQLPRDRGRFRLGRKATAPRRAGRAGLGLGAAAGHRREDHEAVALAHRRRQALEDADVLVVEIDVDVAVELALG